MRKTDCLDDEWYAQEPCGRVEEKELDGDEWLLLYATHATAAEFCYVCTRTVCEYNSTALENHRSDEHTSSSLSCPSSNTISTRMRGLLRPSNLQVVARLALTCSSAADTILQPRPQAAEVSIVARSSST